jgi:hypothetical protein
MLSVTRESLLILDRAVFCGTEAFFNSGKSASLASCVGLTINFSYSSYVVWRLCARAYMKEIIMVNIMQSTSNSVING